MTPGTLAGYGWRLPAALAVAIAVALLLIAPAAQASRGQVSIIQDDAMLANPALRDTALDEFAALGADWVHVLVRWDRIAPSPDAKRAPSFDAGDPAAYPPGAWDGLDAIVRGARARGLEVLMTPSGPVPRWASAGARSRVWKPKPRRFGRFVQALGVRYSGTYARDGGEPLPRVKRWSVWNEPNQPGWLQPQFERNRPYSAHLYRRLFQHADSALRRSGHRRDLLLAGELAPLGDRGTSKASKMRPGRFLRELFCLRSRHSSCRGRYKRLRASGIAHHPYVKFRNQTPRTKPPARDDFPIGATSRLTALLNRAGRAGRIRRGIPIYFTEFGWQSSPPDRLFGVSLARQAEYINESEFMGYNWSRVRAYAQYLLRDEPDLAGFQTGLHYEDGRSKPTLDAYRTPLALRRRGRRISFWGRVREKPRRGRTVTVLRSSRRTSGFRKSGGVTKSDRRGYFRASRLYRKGFWRVRWENAAGQTRYSRVVSSPRR